MGWLVVFLFWLVLFQNFPIAFAITLIIFIVDSVTRAIAGG